MRFSEIPWNWVNEDGHTVSSHVIILPSATRREQIDVEVCPRTFKMAKVTYIWPQVMFDERIVSAGEDLDDTHAKVTSYKEKV